MGLNTLETAYTNGQVIDASHVNEITAAIIGDFIGRDTNGVPSVGQSLGTLAIPWGSIYGSTLIIDGEVIDTDQIVTQANRVISGRTRTLSGQPDFLEASGSLAEFYIKGATTNLLLSVNGIAATVNTDITKSGITLAPSSNNTATVNSVGLTNDKFLGEDDTEIPITSAGSEFTSRVGQICAFKVGTEIFIGFLKSTTAIVNAYRGFFFDSTRTPVSRANMSHGDTITILQIGWVFVEDNGTTVDVSYTTPVYQYEAPTGVTGAYWFDLSAQVWKRYSGTTWEIIDRILVGSIVSDSAACKWTRSLDFAKAFSDENTIELSLYSTEIVRSKKINSKVNVYGSNIYHNQNFTSWNITTDLDTGISEAASTVYYLYLTSEGQRKISDVKPFDRRGDLRGYYHPFNDWRCAGIIYNSSTSDISMWDEIKYNPNKESKKAYISDVKPINTAGGTFTSGAWRTRDLNTINETGSTNTEIGSIASLSANQFVLLPGKYRIQVNVPSNQCGANRAKLYNVSSGSDILLSGTGFANTTYAQNSWVSIHGTVTVTSPTICEIRHWSVTGKSTDGFGFASNIASEVYTQVEIEKIG